MKEEILVIDWISSLAGEQKYTYDHNSRNSEHMTTFGVGDSCLA